jgi:hypothetical protein
MTVSITGWRRIPASIKKDYLPPMLNSLQQVIFISTLLFVISYLHPTLLTSSCAAFSLLVLFITVVIWLVRLLFFDIAGESKKEQVVSVVEKEQAEVTHSRFYQPISQWVIKNLTFVSLAQWESAYHWLNLIFEGVNLFVEKILDVAYDSFLSGARLGLGFAVALIFIKLQGFEVETFIETNLNSFIGSLIALAIVNLGSDLIFGESAETIETELTDDEVEVVVDSTPELSEFLQFSLYVENALRHVVSLLSFLLVATYPVKELMYQLKFLEILLGLVMATVVISLVESLFTIDIQAEPNFISPDWRLNYAITLIMLVSLMLIWLFSVFIPQNFMGQLINTSIILPLLGVIMLISLIVPFVRGDE